MMITMLASQNFRSPPANLTIFLALYQKIFLILLDWLDQSETGPQHQLCNARGLYVAALLY